MGTRWLLRLKHNGKVYACLYFQYDGYHTDDPAKLIKWINSFQLRNEINKGTLENESIKWINGIDELYLQIIAYVGNKNLYKKTGVYLENSDIEIGGSNVHYDYELNSDNSILSISDIKVTITNCCLKITEMGKTTIGKYQEWSDQKSKEDEDSDE